MKLIFKLQLFFGLVIFISGCAGAQRSNYYKEPNESRPAVDEKYRLSADRKKFEELRNEIPQDTQKQNDEVAFTLQLMSEVKLSPSSVRSKFDSALRKKREVFQKDLQKEREVFNKTEQKNRDVFLKSMDSERKDFLKFKHPKEERDDFFSKQDEKRKEYFENQRERRADFESDVTERRKNFEDYTREKTNEFNQDWRAYQKRYEENEKQKKLEKDKGKKDLQVKNIDPTNQDEVKSFLEELDQLNSKPSTSLESGQ